MTETVLALLALTPFIIGAPLLGKQLDIKHKSMDAARYGVWERTVWRSHGSSNRKGDLELLLELRDRTLGNPRAGITPVAHLQSHGISENPLWRDGQRRRLLDYEETGAPASVAHEDERAPVDVGTLLAPAIAHGGGPLSSAEGLLQVSALGLDRRSFASNETAVAIRPFIAQVVGRRRLDAVHEPDEAPVRLLQSASGAILSDAWSVSDEDDFRRRVDRVTVDELIDTLQRPGRAIGMQALGRGRPLYGEGQYGWDPDLRVRSEVLPAAYIERK
ncbi:MAG: hypothetical protein RBS02_12475 [Steroidobacteraceae bacterium]|jgi:hypothetical protein|nr:hypothetical protein [Steroidobacteraceae bacterium]